MFLVLYFAVSLIMLYHEALDCYRNKCKFEIVPSLVFSLGCLVSIPWSIYSIWKELKDPECVECYNKESVGHKMSCSKRKWK